MCKLYPLYEFIFLKTKKQYCLSLKCRLEMTDCVGREVKT